MMTTLQKNIKKIIVTAILCISLSPTSKAVDVENPMQFATALASYPATLIAQMHPNSNVCAFIEYSIKCLNEAIALYNQQGVTNVPWFFYDGIQSLRTFGAVITASDLDEQELQKLIEATAHIKKEKLTVKKQQDADTNEQLTDATETKPTEEKETEESLQTEQALAFAFATLEAAARVWASLINSKETSTLKKDQLYRYREIITGACSMARLANYLIRTKANKYKALILALIAVNAVGTIFTYNSYQNHLPEVEEQEKVMAAIREKRPYQVPNVAQDANKKPAAEAFDPETFTTCYEELSKDTNDNQLNNMSADGFCDKMDKFCKNNGIQPFFDEPKDSANSHRQYALVFWPNKEQLINPHNYNPYNNYGQYNIQQPNDTPQEVARKFVRAFQGFVAEQERALEPIRRRRPLFDANQKKAAAVVFNNDDFTACCRLFGMKGKNYDSPQHFQTEFDEFCGRFGIGKFFDSNDGGLRRHKELFAEYWDLTKNGTNRRPKKNVWDWQGPYYNYNPFTEAYNGRPDPFGMGYQYQRRNDDRKEIINNFCNGFRDYCADQRN